MKLHKTLLKILLFVVFPWAVQAQEDGGREGELFAAAFPDLNSWQLSLQLVREKRLQDQVEASPTQIAELRLIHSDRRFRDLLEEAARKDGSRVNGRNINTFFWKIEDEIREALLEVLYPQQLAKLRLELIRYRFPAGWSPFQRKNILDLLDLDRETKARLIVEVESQAQAVSQEMDAARIRGASAVIESLPEAAKVRMASLQGINATPESQRLALGDPPPPFAGNTFTPRTLELLLADQELMKRLQISDEQRTNLKSYLEAFSSEIRDPSVYKSGKERFTKAQEKLLSSARGLFNHEQIVALRQTHTRYFFFANYTTLADSPDVVKFLGLDESETRKFQAKASREHERLTKLESDLHRSAFLKLAHSLGEEHFKTLSFLFKRVWEAG